MRSEADSLDILERALKAANADEADAAFISSDSNITRFANSNIIQNMSEISAELTLRVFVGGAMGIASTTSFDSEAIAETANIAREAAKHSPRVPDFKGLYRGGQAILPVRTDKIVCPPPSDKARALKHVFEHDAKFAGSYGTTIASVACGNTHGVRRYAAMSSSEATVIAIRGEESGYATTIARDGIDVIALGNEAMEKATLREGKREAIDAGAYDVILEPPATAEVLEWLDVFCRQPRKADPLSEPDHR